MSTPQNWFVLSISSGRMFASWTRNRYLRRPLTVLGAQGLAHYDCAGRALLRRQADEHVREQLTGAIVAGANTLALDQVMSASSLTAGSRALSE